MRSIFLAVSGAAIMAASAVSAGGYAAPVVEPEPVAVVVPPAPTDWAGGYAGVALGYAFGGDDRIGENVTGDVTTIGKAELQGANLGLRAGYRWQRDRWVIGPELSYTAGNITDDFRYGAGGKFESKVDSVLAVKLKTGYAVQPDMLVYGIAGWQTGSFTYTNNGKDTDYDADGYVLGLGVERKLNDKLSITGEYEYSNFGKTSVDLGNGIITKATPEFSNIKLGLNFRF